MQTEGVGLERQGWPVAPKLRTILIVCLSSHVLALNMDRVEHKSAVLSIQRVAHKASPIVAGLEGPFAAGVFMYGSFYSNLLCLRTLRHLSTAYSSALA